MKYVRLETIQIVHDILGVKEVKVKKLSREFFYLFKTLILMLLEIKKECLIER